MLALISSSDVFYIAVGIPAVFAVVLLWTGWASRSRRGGGGSSD